MPLYCSLKCPHKMLFFRSRIACWLTRYECKFSLTSFRLSEYSVLTPTLLDVSLATEELNSVERAWSYQTIKLILNQTQEELQTITILIVNFTWLTWLYMKEDLTLCAVLSEKENCLVTLIGDGRFV